ncbi:dipeptidase [Phaeacidiphilus oryzae]|uniref:dipeptidase n=1 Tax=Phaeacidiphilus oryzae TaxID=348818 RepID=UPI00056AB82C|nr:dipeptidase [Phaeacidiphilus oryzae]
MTAELSPSVEELTARVDALMGRARADLGELVAIPSVADPRQFPPEECERAARWVAEAFRELGFADARLALTPDGTHAVVGERPGPEGAPTVLLYAHYDVQPPLGEERWTTPPFELTERPDGRWYGRGAADCKGNLVMHLTALRALLADGGEIPVRLKIVIEGSEEQGTGGLERYLAEHPEDLRADAIVIADSGNAAVGVPTATSTLRGAANLTLAVSTLAADQHSGAFGGAAPDALAALIRALDSLRRPDGTTAIEGLADFTEATWDGTGYDEQTFRSDAGVLGDEIHLIGSGSVADRVWARPAVTVLGIDCPPVVGSAAAVPATAKARVSLRVPPGLAGQRAYDALAAHLRAAVPWGARVEIEPEFIADPFRARTDGPGYAALGAAMSEAFDGKPLEFQGQGGSIPLCGALQEAFPEAEIMLIGVEEPTCLIHAPNESVHPEEIRRLALAEARFLLRYARTAD